MQNAGALAQARLERSAARVPPREPSNGKALLFLDLDGVICCNRQGQLEQPKLAQLHRVIAATGAKVVLSTDWRRYPEAKQRAESTLKGLGIECIGATPELPLYSRQRPKEILAWLTAFQEPVATWCAIDDRQLLQEEGGYPALLGHFVLTDAARGLTAVEADQAIKILGRMARLPPPPSPPQLSTQPAKPWQPEHEMKPMQPTQPIFKGHDIFTPLEQQPLHISGQAPAPSQPLRSPPHSQSPPQFQSPWQPPRQSPQLPQPVQSLVQPWSQPQPQPYQPLQVQPHLAPHQPTGAHDAPFVPPTGWSDALKASRTRG